jgi:hypothetical protein
MNSSWTDAFLFRRWHPIRFNCWTLVCEVYSRVFGEILPTYEGIRASDQDKVSVKMEEQRMGPDWSLSEGKDWDVAALGIGEVVHHVGVLLPGGKEILHVNANTMGMIETISELKKRFKTIKFYTYAGRHHH